MKLLIVEDDNFLLQIYHQLFKLEGIEVETASDGFDALEKLKNAATVPDGVVLDVMMPKMDGFQFLAERLKEEKLRNLPVIVLTNLYSEADKKKALDLGARAFILKSNQDPKELVAQIKQAFVAPVQ